MKTWNLDGLRRNAKASRDVTQKGKWPKPQGNSKGSAMSNEAQRLYGALSEKARERGDELVNHAIELANLQAQRDALLAAAEDALAHVNELAEAWQRGSISSHDGKQGIRSNRNTAIEINLRQAIAACKE